ncbi:MULTISPECIES: type I methionyl aminopeptidase [Tissierellales]|jgi:methionyl aminopeptidase|uniref:Methionine aminopeptidase n=1 Tax=Acidilutibacter cellobiosedens TaxID=2507161 RepID=A0A410QEJ8_9FIRM|nr:MULTISPECIES: type I methionyl aminopeptidase [Tissierellales]MBE6081649.1 type I methionyl aminopeptidase [Tissierellaceae bacterium]QAT62453.1 type I methionyl aminopeptidase [Acidilutibacter cellobiosedens]SCL89030.1 Methionine aminopeptidase 1 [Sporanaerobacter sp. PP17-6a]
MIILKTENEIEKMQKAGRILANCHKEIKKMIRPGISTYDIDKFAEEFIKKNGATPEQKGYQGYPFATCTSVNDEICHGFPGKKPLRNGDIVTVDMVVNLNGWLADSAWSYAVGNISEEAKKLMEVTEKSLYIGIEKAVAGNRIGDISYAIQSYVEAQGFSVVRDFVGHGIGKEMHEEPQVPHFGRPGRGPRITTGMVFTIEPMINVGTYHCTIDNNNWTARTKDGKLSCQYEHTIAITENGVIIITKQ